jgi:hypothetical protein
MGKKDGSELPSLMDLQIHIHHPHRHCATTVKPSFRFLKVFAKALKTEIEITLYLPSMLSERFLRCQSGVYQFIGNQPLKKF